MGISSQDSPHCTSVREVQELLSRLSVTTTKISLDGISFMSMFNDISWGSKDKNKRMRIKCSTRFLSMRRELEHDNGHFFGPGSEKKWYSTSEDSPQGE